MFKNLIASLSLSLALFSVCVLSLSVCVYVIVSVRVGVCVRIMLTYFRIPLCQSNCVSFYEFYMACKSKGVVRYKNMLLMCLADRLCV